MKSFPIARFRQGYNVAESGQFLQWGSLGKFFTRCLIWMKFGTRVGLKRWNDRGEFELDRTKSKNGQRHVKRDLRTYAKSVDPDQPPRLRCRVWSGSALFDTRHINGTYISCCVSNWNTCIQMFSTTCRSWSWSTLFVMSEGPFSRDAGQLN